LDLGPNGILINLVHQTLNKRISVRRHGKASYWRKIDCVGPIGEPHKLPAKPRNVQGRRLIHLGQGHSVIHEENGSQRPYPVQDILPGKVNEIQRESRGEDHGLRGKAVG
jgi:hypothetical protein